MKKVAKTLGEIALRVEDIDEMQAFYENVIGLELMRRFPSTVFFKIADGYAGHTQILALFDRTASKNYIPIDPPKTTVDHIAFTVSIEDFWSERERLLGLGLEILESVHPWVQWRSLYVHDPEGNMVEFVCLDPSIEPEA